MRRRRSTKQIQVTAACGGGVVICSNCGEPAHQYGCSKPAHISASRWRKMEDDARLAAEILDPLDQILESAKHHGEDSESDHEVGDLQDALRLAWAELSAEARVRVRAAYFETHDHWDEKT